MNEDPGLLLFLLIVLIGAPVALVIYWSSSRTRLNDRLSDQRRARESGAKRRR
jgi:hypothetical protein